MTKRDEIRQYSHLPRTHSTTHFQTHEYKKNSPSSLISNHLRWKHVFL